MTTIYVISIDDIPDGVNVIEMDNTDFIKFALVYGQAYTPKEFETAFNDQDVNSYTDQIRIITNEDIIPLLLDNAINYIDNQETEVENMTDKDPYYVIGWLKQSLRTVKNMIQAK